MERTLAGCGSSHFGPEPTIFFIHVPICGIAPSATASFPLLSLPIVVSSDSEEVSRTKRRGNRPASLPTDDRGGSPTLPVLP